MKHLINNTILKKKGIIRTFRINNLFESYIVFFQISLAEYLVSKWFSKQQFQASLINKNFILLNLQFDLILLHLLGLQERRK